jgi:hypothetical protein
VADYYWFAVPEKLVEADEVPEECGLMWVSNSFSVPIVVKGARRLDATRTSEDFTMDLARRAYQVGRRDGTRTCAFERLDMVSVMASMLIKNDASAVDRKAAVLAMSRAVAKMQRHPEAQELARIAKGDASTTSFWHVARTLHSGSRTTQTTPVKKPGTM